MQKTKLVVLDQVNVKFEGLDASCRRKVSEALKFMVPYARHTPKFKLGRWDGKVGFATIGGQTYLNALDRVLPIIMDEGYDVEVDDRRHPHTFNFKRFTTDSLSHIKWPEGHPNAGEPIILRDHQVTAINTYLDNPQSMQEIATGAGKTAVTASLSTAVEPYGRSLVIVPGKDLVRQTFRDYANIGLDTGRYYGDFKEPDNVHTIATWQSLTAAAKNNPEMLDRILDGTVCVMVDEAHTIAGKELRDLLTGRLANIPIRWGLTGTVPKDMHEFMSLLVSIGPVVGEVTASELQEKGILANCHIDILQTIDDVEFADYDGEKHYLSTDKKRVQWITELCEKVAQTGNTLVLINSIEMGKEISEALGVTFVSGQMKSAKRGEEYDSINQTDNKLLLATYGVASTGISINRIFNLILIDAGKSPKRIIQSIGRGLRVASDKDFVNIFDACSNAKFSKSQLTKRKSYYKEKGYPFTVKKIKYR